MEPKNKPKPLGALLKENGLITEESIRFALQEQKITKEKIGEILERLCFVTGNDVVMALAEQNGFPYLDVDSVLPEKDILKLFNKKFCLNNIFLPIRKKEKSLEERIKK